MFSANLACDAAGCDSGNFQNYFPPTLSNVMFYDGSTLLGSAPALTVSSNDGGFSDWAAQFSTSSLSPGTHTITATYADTNYSLSTSNAQTVFVGGTPTLTWTTPAAIAYGTALSATQLNATDTIPGTFVYSPASGTIPGVGTQSLHVTFTAADYTDFGQQTKTVPLTVSQAATSIAVSNVSPSSEAYGQDSAVTITAVLSWSGSGSAPTANVSIGGNGNGSYSATSCGAASGNTITCTATYTPTASDTAGSYTETAVFSGDTNYTGSSSSQTGNFAVTQAGSGSITVSSSQNPSNDGTAVTFTATIPGQYGQVTGRKPNGKKPMDVTGTVTWTVNGNPITDATCGGGTTSVTSGNPGTATCTTTSLPVGASDTVTANYSGDSNHNSGSGSVVQTVNAVGASVAVGSTLNPADYGAAVSFTATVSGISPTGTVAFYVNGSLFDTEALVSGTATSISTSTLAVGTYTVTATYSGDSNNLGGSGTLAGGQVINLASTTTAVTSTPNPSTYAQSVTFTATITGENSLVKSRKPSRNGMKPMDPGGSVTWSANTGCAPSTVSGNPGVATCTTSSASHLPVGTDAVTATYSGDSNHNGSTGSVNQVVTGGIATTIDVTNVSPASEEFGANTPVAITAVLSWTGHGVAPTAANVSIGGNGNGTYGATSCAARVHETITCTATYTPTNADAAGTYTETATFSGDSNYSASSSPETNNFTITSNASTTTVTSGLNPSAYGQAVTFTATITSDTGDVKGRNAGKKGMQPMQPSGTVTWSANTGCAASTVSGVYPGVATCTTSSLGLGSDTVAATYSGDSDHGGSSGSVIQTVNPGTATVVLSNLTQTYTGSALSPTCTTTPSGLGVTLSPASETNAGSYSETCTINPGQNYTGSASGTFVINKASQTINVTTPAPSSVVKGSIFTVVASASSGLSVNFASSGACTNSGGTYTMANTASGTCTETMTQTGNSNYAAATAVTETTTIAAAIAPAVTFTGAPTSAPYQSAFTVSATTNASTTAVITATPATVCTISGNTVTMVSGTGTCMMKASWAADDVYKAATATQTTKAAKIAPTATFTGAPSTAVYQSTFTVAASTNASTTAAITATPASVCTISSGTVTMASGTGTCTTTAKWAADADYLAATLTQTTTAQELTSTVSWTAPSPITYGTTLSGVLNATANVAGKFAYTANGNAVTATTVLSAGSYTMGVTFTPTASKDYPTATASVSLTVNPINTTTTITKASAASRTAPLALTVSFTVANGLAAAHDATGSVTVTASSGETCTAALAMGKGSCVLTTAAAESGTLTAVYSGDSNDNGSTSAAFSFTD
jgi:hypothetical protein